MTVTNDLQKCFTKNSKEAVGCLLSTAMLLAVVEFFLRDVRPELAVYIDSY